MLKQQIALTLGGIWSLRHVLRQLTPPQYPRRREKLFKSQENGITVHTILKEHMLRKGLEGY